MANTLAGIYLAQIAEETLNVLEPKMPRLDAFFKDFSSDILTEGNTVTTRVPTKVTAVDVSGGYTGQDVTTTAKTITLDKEYGFPMAFKDSEISKAGNMERLRRIFIRPAVNSVLRQISNHALGLVLYSNYTAEETITAANFSYDKVVDQDAALSLADAMDDRFLIVNPTYLGTMRKDTKIASAFAGGNPELIQKGRVGQVGGFDVVEYNNIPANGENLAAIAMAPEAILIAARQPALPQGFAGEVENVTDPTTGLPLQFRLWYEGTQKKTYLTVEAYYGVAVGVPGNLRAIRSANRS